MTPNPQSRESTGTPPTLRALVLYFLRLGTFGFGGPIALVGYMQRDLVERKKWVSREDYFEGLAFSQLCPGPLAAQLTEYIGWVHSGTLGATLTGAAFVLPSFLMVLALALLYVHFGQLAWIQGLFYGIGAAVSAIIVRSAWKAAYWRSRRSGDSRRLFGYLCCADSLPCSLRLRPTSKYVPSERRFSARDF